MAFFSARDQFDIGNVNLNFYIKHYYDGVVFDDEDFILGGKVYEDFFVINGYSYPNDLVLAMGGQDFTFNKIGQLSGGTATVLTAQTITGIELWYADGFAITASTIYLAASTTTNSDDLSVFSTALAGHDTIKLSALADSFDGFSGNDSIFGYGGNDILRGSGGNDAMEGGSGNDVLDGGTGADRLIGGTGNDSYVIDNIGDKVIEIAGQGTEIVKSSISYSLVGLHVENLTLTGLNAINGIGNSFVNILTGNALPNILKAGSSNDRLLGGNGNDKLYGDSGNDVVYGQNGNDLLDGGIGADKLIGGTGNDIYVVDNIGDRVTELASQGADTVKSSISYSLSGLHAEKLSLTGSKAINGIGNGVANILSGNAAANTLKAGSGNDRLIGGNGDDRLYGEAGTDFLFGQKGNDILSGATGADHFVFNRGDGHDRILDFRAGQDVIEIDSGATRFAQLDIHSAGKATVVEFADVVITLAGIRPAQLDADDFSFV